MPNIDFIASYGLPRDIPPGLHYIRCFQLQVENSVKPIFFTAGSLQDLMIILDMASAVAGSKEELSRYPFLIQYSEPTSPLTHSEEAVSKLICCAENRIPINYTPALLAGSTGPVTLAGALSVAVAEALSGLVIHQLSHKGAPIITGVVATEMDMLRATTPPTRTFFTTMTCPSGEPPAAAIPNFPTSRQEPNTGLLCSMPHWTAPT
jgi:trimethylamine--corrinoid protein Co-methyltransferase